MIWLLVIPGAAAAALVALAIGDAFLYEDPRPTCNACDQPRPASTLNWDGICIPCLSAVPLRTMLPRDVEFDLTARKEPKHRILDARVRHREDLRRQRADLLTLLNAVDDQLSAHDEVTAEVALEERTPGGAR